MKKLMFVLMFVILLFGCTQKTDDINNTEQNTNNNNIIADDSFNSSNSDIKIDSGFNSSNSQNKTIEVVQGQNSNETNSGNVVITTGSNASTTGKMEVVVDGQSNGRLQTLKSHLHTPGSGDEAKTLFPDFVKVYTDYNTNPYFAQVIPFTYYYSAEEDITVSICNIKYTVFICKGKIDRLIQESDYVNCNVAKEYLYPGQIS